MCVHLLDVAITSERTWPSLSHKQGKIIRSIMDWYWLTSGSPPPEWPEQWCISFPVFSLQLSSTLESFLRLRQSVIAWTSLAVAVATMRSLMYGLHSSGWAGTTSSSTAHGPGSQWPLLDLSSYSPYSISSFGKSYSKQIRQWQADQDDSSP